MATTADVRVLGRRLDTARETFNSGHPARAVRQYDALRRRYADAHREVAELGVPYARVLLGLALSGYEVSGGLDRALSLLDEAERVADGRRAEGLTAVIRGQRGLLLLRAGHTDEAHRALDRAVAASGAATPYDRVSILLNRGALRIEHGRLRDAREDLARAVEVAASAGLRELEHRARHNLGYAEFLAGRIPAALAAMDRALAVVDGPPHPISMLDKARVLREAGLTRDADRLLGAAAERFAAGRLHQDVAETRLAQAECALTEGDPGRARRLAGSAERVFARRGNVRWRRVARLLVLRCERRALEDRPAARRPAALRALAAAADRLASDCHAEGREDLSRLARLLELECLLRAGPGPVAGTPEPPEPPEPPAPPVPPLRRSDPLPVRMATLEVGALAARRRGDGRRASALVRRGLAELGSYQNRFGSLDLRTASAVHGVPIARVGVEVALDGGGPAALFAAVEHARALSSRLPSVRPPADERTADLLAALRQAEEQARSVTVGDGAAELAGLRSRAAALRREIRARAWELEGADRWASQRPPVRLGAVRAAAADLGTAFVSLVAHEGRWLAVRATGSRPLVVELASVAEVDERVDRIRADLDALALSHLPPALSAAVRGSLEAGLARLDALLLAPLRVGDGPLVLSASGSLVLLPWTLLPSRRGRSTVVTPGAEAWLRPRHTGRDHRRARPRVVAVAGPGLTRAEEEAELVRRTWPSARLLRRDRASTAAVADALGHADVVHVAAHGSHQQDSPLFSSLRLADGPLFAYELDAGGVPAPCVALSACEAGLATLRPGDEGLGFTSVLLHLGSVSVLAGVARVGDEVAARVMARVHQGLAGGAPSAQALADALAEEDEPAPFVAFGASW